MSTPGYPAPGPALVVELSVLLPAHGKANQQIEDARALVAAIEDVSAHYSGTVRMDEVRWSK